MANRFIVFLFAIISSTTIMAQEYSLSKEANLLADSDVLSVQQIPYFYADGNGENLVWDFSDNISNEGSSKLWLQKDALSRNAIMSTNGITYCIYNGDTLFVAGKESPLSKTSYKRLQLLMHYPLSYGDSISAPFFGDGVYCGDHPYREQGASTVMADARGSIVLEGDTIPNVMRVYTLRTYSICMDIDSSALDTARLKQVIEERYDWYAQGYRYPLFTTISSTSYANMEAIGTEQKAFCMLHDKQGLLSDAYNEEVRKNDSTANADREKGETDIIHYILVQSGNVVSINYSLDAAADITALVSDAKGIVYRRGHQHGGKGDNYTMTINCNGLHLGEYILYINVNGKVYSEKVTIL